MSKILISDDKIIGLQLGSYRRGKDCLDGLCCSSSNLHPIGDKSKIIIQ